MLKRHPHWTVFAILLILAPWSHSGARADAPWYQFEIIVFERIAKGAGSTELWPEDPGTPSRLDARPIGLSAGRGADNASEPVAYEALPSSAWQLAELTQRLRRSRNFRPHVHLAWRQQMVDPDDAQPLYIEMMDKPNAKNRVRDLPKLEGTIKVGIQRYLHFETDLLLRRLKAQEASSEQTGMLPLPPSTQAYRLQSKRRMRSGKLHYLDHPVFGVLVFASRYEPPKPAEPEILAPPAIDPQSAPAAESQTDEPKVQASPEAVPSPPTE